MAQVPDHLGADAVRRIKQRQEARPVVLSRRGLDQVPAQAVARGPDVVPSELAVVGLGQQIVSGCRQQVEAMAIRSAMGRAFEAAKQKTSESGNGRQRGSF